MKFMPLFMGNLNDYTKDNGVPPGYMKKFHRESGLIAFPAELFSFMGFYHVSSKRTAHQIDNNNANRYSESDNDRFHPFFDK